jgi:hypothetical protein
MRRASAEPYATDASQSTFAPAMDVLVRAVAVSRVLILSQLRRWFDEERASAA